jgi:PAS domain S-box-containing protein
MAVQATGVDFEKLRKSETLLAEAEKIGQVGCWEYDLVTGETIWSANLCRMLEIDPARTKVSGGLFWELLHPDDRETVRAVIEFGMKAAHEYEYQSRFVLPGGRERTFYTYGRPVLGPNKQVIKRIGLSQDITPRVEAQRALLESERRYRDMVESSDDLICTHDLNGQILSMNELPARLLGYHPDELIGLRIPDRLDAHDEFTEYIDRLKRDGCANGLMGLTTKSGERRIWEYRNTLRPDNAVVCGMARDVTERIQSQKDLRASTARFKALLDSIDEIAFEFDADGTFLDIWTTNQDLLFLPRAKLIGRRVSDVMSEGFAPTLRGLFKRILESGKGEDIEHSLALPDGEHCFLCRVTPVVLPNGTYKSVCVLARDITDRKKAEKSLNLFRTLIDRSNDAIEVVDPITLRFLDVNERACSEVGYTREEMLGMSVYDIDPSLTPDESAKVMEALIHSRSLISERVHRRKDGSVFPVEINLSLVDLDTNYVVAIARDISERKRAERAMRCERDRVQQYLNIADVILLVLDRDATITLINRKGCTLLGWQEHELIGRNWIDTCLPPSTRSALRESFANLLAGDCSYIENLVMTRDGEERLIGWHNTVLRDAEGNIVSSLSSGEDITERKTAENALRQLSGLLLRSQDHERRTIAREVHDGIGTSISGLSLALGKLRQFLDDDNPEHRRVLSDCRELIQTAAAEIRTISYLLHPPTLEELGLAPALTQLTEGFSSRSGIRTALSLPKNLGRFSPEIELTFFRVTQEALNNVLHHSGSKSADIRIFRQAGQLVLRVADRGKGIPKGFRGEGLRFSVGIAGMQERLRNIGGRLTIKTLGARGGCVVRASIAVDKLGEDKS